MKRKAAGNGASGSVGDGGKVINTGWALAAGLLASSVAPAVAPAQIYQLSDIAGGVLPTGFTILGASDLDLAGVSVSAAGDVNGDGLGDVVVGASLADPAGLGYNNNAGEAYVVFGKSTGDPVDLADIRTGASTAGFVMRGEAVGDQAGNRVSGAGDVNGDGLADVIVGARRSDFSAVDAGRAWVVFGRTATTPIELSAVSAGAAGSGFAINAPANAGARMGIVSGAGDVNGDGLDDVIASAYLGASANNTSTGVAFVVFGKTSTTAVNTSTIFGGSSALGFPIDGETNSGQMGLGSSGAGDVNGDGLADVVLGAPTATANGGYSAGMAYVVFGKTSGSRVNLTALAAGTSSLGFRIVSEVGGNDAGRYVAGLGDVNGDGLSDVAVGARTADTPGGAASGRVYVVYGRTGGAPVALSAISTGSSSLGWVIDGQAANELLGPVGAAGDVDGDGLADVLVGGEQSSPGGLNRAGRAYLVLGKPSTESVSVTETSTLARGVGFEMRGSASGDYAGSAVSGAGDVNGDGLADLVVGASYADPPGRNAAGVAYVVFSPRPPHADGHYRSRVAGGNPNRAGIGTAAWGDSATTHSNARAWIDFADGTGPSVATARVVRSLTGFSNLPAGLRTLPVGWVLTTNRTGWTSAALTLRYTNAELGALSEAGLSLWRADSPAGPWTQVPGSNVDAARNEISGAITTPGSFIVGVLDAAAPTATITLPDANPTSLDAVRFNVLFSESVGTSFTAGDVSLVGTLSGGASTSVSGAGSSYAVFVRPVDPNANGTIAISLSASGITDLAGNLHAGSSSASYTIQNPSRADIDNNGVVNVADVTALADHIVNGTPLP